MLAIQDFIPNSDLKNPLEILRDNTLSQYPRVPFYIKYRNTVKPNTINILKFSTDMFCSGILHPQRMLDTAIEVFDF